MKTIIRLIMFMMLFAIVVSAQSNPPAPCSGDSIAKPIDGTGNKKKNATINKPVSEGFPAIVEISKAPIIQIESTDKTEKKYWYSFPEWWMVSFTFLLACITGALALYTGKLYRATVKLGEQADAVGKQQAADVQKSIAEAAKAATAMKDVAGSMSISARAATQNVNILRERTAMQMRAYLSVAVGGGVFQERVKALKFEVKPALTNSGHTPAHNVSYWAKAAILPVPLPEDFQFPTGEDIHASYVLGPGASSVMNAMVDDYVDDEEVDNIKRGVEKSLYIWGVVTYLDVFGESHITRFCHNIYWEGPFDRETISGLYAKKHNEAT